jgi:GalNAc5-diNAcBac-PP-undecaprenol beta-1,3-glucosyltransferase
MVNGASSAKVNTLMISISVVIPTYNRPQLLKRAIRSVIKQNRSPLSIEVVVIDDCSVGVVDLAEFDTQRITYKRLERNSGPQIARNEGIKLATGDWVIMLDDDDEFIENTLATAFNAITDLKNKELYPVFFFATTNGRIPTAFQLIGARDIMNQTLKGDFTPVIQRHIFLEHHLKYLDYPEIVGVGCEQLTWLYISSLVQIPTFSFSMVKVNADAPLRLTSYSNFIRNSFKFALQQDITIDFIREHKLDKIYPPFLSKKYLGAAIYYLVSGKKSRTRERLSVVRNYRPVATSVIRILSYLPVGISELFFRVYKIQFSK